MVTLGHSLGGGQLLTGGQGSGGGSVTLIMGMVGVGHIGQWQVIGGQVVRNGGTVGNVGQNVGGGVGQIGGTIGLGRHGGHVNGNPPTPPGLPSPAILIVFSSVVASNVDKFVS